MVRIMGVINLSPDSFFGPSRCRPEDFASRVTAMVGAGASIIDVGAVSTRPGAAAVDPGEEWSRLEPVLRSLPPRNGWMLSVDTRGAETVRRVYDLLGPFMVNDISAGEDDPGMLPLVGKLALPFVAMHKRGGPATMDSMCDYPDGIMNELRRYFERFAARAEENGIDEWILDPGLGFAKTEAQCIEILENLGELKTFGRSVLVGVSDKRFTKHVKGGTPAANALALRQGADILRVHDVAAAASLLGKQRLDLVGSGLDAGKESDGKNQ